MVWGVIRPGFGVSVGELVEISSGIGYVDTGGIRWSWVICLGLGAITVGCEFDGISALGKDTMGSVL